MKLLCKMIILNVLIVMSNGCGVEEKTDTRTGPKGDKGDPGESCTVSKSDDGAIIACPDGSQEFIPNGKNGQNGQDYIPEEEQTWTGFYVLDNGGYVELLQLDDGRVQLYGTQRLYSVNFDDDLALHPNLPAGPHILKTSDNIFGEYNTNYDASTNDLERDDTTTNITGTRKTVYNISFVDGLLNIHIMIYSSNGLSIEADRVIKEL